MYSNRIRKIRKTGQYFSDLNGKIRDDLKIYKAKELESVLRSMTQTKRIVLLVVYINIQKC